MKRAPSSTESPVLYTVFTSSPVTTSSALGLNRILFLCTDIHWVKTKLICLLLLYVAKLIPSSAHFLRSLVCSTKFVLLQNVDVHYFVLLCLQTWLIWVWAFSAGTKASYSVHFIDAQTFHNISVYIPLFLWIQFKINGSYLGLFSGDLFTLLTLKLLSINRDCNS